MKKIIITIFILSFVTVSSVFAASVGGPDMTVPEESLFLKQEVVNKTLDKYEPMMNIKTGLDMEFVFKREVESAPIDVSSAELQGYNFMIKVSNNFNDIIEPYIKIGTSKLEVEWVQHGGNVRVESGTGFALGVGTKLKLLGLQNDGFNLTLDLQYRQSDLGIDKAEVGGSTSTASPINETFQSNEWQIGLLASKKLILPVGTKDYYLVPYGGLTFSFMDLDVSFTQSTTGGLYSTYNADDENPMGLVFGCDIMPFYLSYYLLNLELRLMNETALTLGGTIKF